MFNIRHYANRPHTRYVPELAGWIMVREARVVPSEAGPDHVLALMPVAAVALLESTYPIGSQPPFWAHPVVVGAMHAADEPCHVGEQRDRLVRVRIRDIGNEAGA
jgi:hypothetical protein